MFIKIIGYILVFLPLILIFGYMFIDDWKKGLIVASIMISIITGMYLI